MKTTSHHAARRVSLWAGTRKGAFLFTSDGRRRAWKIAGPFFAGREVCHVMPDPRTGLVWAAVNSVWFGSELRYTANRGKTWKKGGSLKFSSDKKLKVARIWSVTPDRDDRPGTLWCGIDPGALFRSDDHGRNWREVVSLTKHPTRKEWGPGAGGLCLHTVVPDPARRGRIYVAISAAGTFRSDDDGATWTPKNKNVRCDFQPDKYPLVGQCVHRLAMNPHDPDVLYQQNHCGLYRSDDAGDTWTDISRGTPTRFGFPLVVNPRERETIYAVPQKGDESRFFPGAALAVYKSSTGGRSWRKLTRGLPRERAYPGVMRQAACADNCAETGLYVGATNGEIFHSADGGASWRTLAARLPNVLSLQAAVE